VPATKHTTICFLSAFSAFCHTFSYHLLFHDVWLLFFPTSHFQRWLESLAKSSSSSSLLCVLSFLELSRQSNSRLLHGCFSPHFHPNGSKQMKPRKQSHCLKVPPECLAFFFLFPFLHLSLSAVHCEGFLFLIVRSSFQEWNDDSNIMSALLNSVVSCMLPHFPMRFFVLHMDNNKNENTRCHYLFCSITAVCQETTTTHSMSPTVLPDDIE